MCKKNLFEDMTSGEMRQRLQEVSEYMDEIIKSCRRQAKQYKEDVTQMGLWDRAHGRRWSTYPAKLWR